MNDFRKWFEETDNRNERIQQLLESIINNLINKSLYIKKIDNRVLKCIQFIKKSEIENIKLQHAADHVSLSSSRLYHLFKQETGLTFRQFLLNCKLIKSLQSLYNRQNFTEATFFGGFSNQPHFNKTFKKTFGIKPSKIIKKLINTSITFISLVYFNYKN